jgi:hypothetical protein
MALAGEGFLAIWNDTSEGGDAEWVRWHTREHMAERVGVEGFLAGRRYCDAGGVRERYFTLYEGRSLETFSSPPYLARLDDPTPWTRATGSLFRNFTRGACRVVASRGFGSGGTLATLRLERRDRAVPLDRAACHAWLGALVTLEGIVGAHLGTADAGVTKVPTNERSLRSGTEDGLFDSVLLLEGWSRPLLLAALPVVEAALAAGTVPVTLGAVGVYDLSYRLDQADLVRRRFEPVGTSTT